MSDVHAAPDGAGALAPASFTPAETTPTPSDIGRMLAGLRQQRQEPPAESAEPATAEDEIPAQAENAAPVEEQPSGEGPTEAEPAELPPIEPPRSWTKEIKERWSALPREAQEEIARIEQSREREFRRSQNEAAEQRKAIEAERKAAEQARQQYEATLPNLMRALQEAQSGAFSDIKTVDDVTKLATEDPYRYLQWQAHQTRIQAAQHELQRVEEMKQREQQSEWARHVQDENAAFAESLNETDRAKLKDFTSKAPEFLEEIGFKSSELTELASGKQKLSIYDRRLQSLILDGMKYRDAQKASAAAKAKLAEKPVPPVQKPGVPAPRGAAKAEVMRNLSAKLERSGDPRDMAALIGAMRTGA